MLNEQLQDEKFRKEYEEQAKNNITTTILN